MGLPWGGAVRGAGGVVWNLWGRLLVAVMIDGVPPGFTPQHGGALLIASARGRAQSFCAISTVTRCRAGQRGGRLRAVVLVRVGLVRVVRLEGSHSGADSIGAFPPSLLRGFRARTAPRPV